MYRVNEYSRSLFIFTLAKMTLTKVYIYVPPTEGGGTYCFWCGSRRRQRRRPRSFFPTQYLLNQWMDFDLTCIDTWLGGGKELIRFW